LDALDEISYADGATGWVAMAILLATATASGYLPYRTASEMWGVDRLSILAGSGRPGKAEEVEGGFRLTGTWDFGSGIKHSTHAFVTGFVQEDGKSRVGPDGNPEPIMFIVPTADVQLIGNWDVMGLRRTGSVDYRIEGVFVPRDYTHKQWTTESEHGGPLYLLGMAGMGPICHSGWALGVGRRLLDELPHVAKRGARGDSEHFRIEAGNMYARYHAARSLLYRTWEDVERTLEQEEPPSTRQRTMIRLALNHLTSTVAEVATFVYRAAGSASIREGPIQRFFRDAQVGAQHASVNERILGVCARDLLGLDEGAVSADPSQRVYREPPRA